MHYDRYGAVGSGLEHQGRAGLAGRAGEHAGAEAAQVANGVVEPSVAIDVAEGEGMNPRGDRDPEMEVVAAAKK